MSNKYRRRLEEVMSLLPCPVSGCWFVNGAETSYYYHPGEENPHDPDTIPGAR